jgi:hypothetical protein
VKGVTVMHDFPPKAQKQARRIAALMRDHRQRFYEEVSGWEAEASEQYSTELDASRHAVMSHLIETVQKHCRDKKGGALSERWKPFSHVIAKKGPAYQDLLTKHFALAGIPSPTIKLPTEVTDRPMTLREEIVLLAAIHAAVVEKESATERADCFGALIREVSSQRGGEFWSQVALWVDDVEHVLHPSLPEGEVDGLPKGLSEAEFNVLARAYLEEHATEEHIVTARELAEYVGSKNPAGTCSTSTVSKLLCWRAYRDEMERTGRKGKKARPRAVSLTPALEASVGKPDACLEKLMQEQKDDAELSPLEDDLPDEPRVKFQPKIRKQV